MILNLYCCCYSLLLLFWMHYTYVAALTREAATLFMFGDVLTPFEASTFLFTHIYIYKYIYIYETILLWSRGALSFIPYIFLTCLQPSGDKGIMAHSLTHRHARTWAQAVTERRRGRRQRNGNESTRNEKTTKLRGKKPYKSFLHTIECFYYGAITTSTPTTTTTIL